MYNHLQRRPFLLLSRPATVVLLAFITPLSSHIPSRPSAQGNVERSPERITPQDTPPANCRVTLPSDGVYEPPSTDFSGINAVPGDFGPSRTPGQFYFGTDKLWTVLPADGTWRGPYPGGSGDFVFSDKLPWYRTAASEEGGPLTIKGRRLDGPAPSFIETNEDFEYNPGGIVGGISIPAYGCWEITGHYGEQEVTFTVWVTSLTTYEPSSHASSPEILPEQPARTVVVARVHVDGETTARALVYRVVPEIPPAALATNTYGTVVLQAVIGTDGRAHDLSYISGPQPLVQAAMEAVRWYQYRLPVVDVPLLQKIKSGMEPYRAEEVETTVTVLFPPPSN